MPTIVVREITPREPSVIPATVPSNGGHLSLWVPVVRKCEYEPDPILSGCCNHLVEPLQAIGTFVNGCMSTVENLSCVQVRTQLKNNYKYLEVGSRSWFAGDIVKSPNTNDIEAGSSNIVEG